MSKTMTLREANQHFARCIREVEAGEEIVVTRNGVAVARISPVQSRKVLTPVQQAASERLTKAMEAGWDLGGEKFDRGALYDRDAARAEWTERKR
jgi:prevent-host-death family protein